MISSDWYRELLQVDKTRTTKTLSSLRKNPKPGGSPMASLRCIRELSRRATTVFSINQTRSISSLRGLELSGTSITHEAPVQNRSLARDFPWYSRSQGRHFASKTNDTDESSDGEDEEEYEDSAEMEVEREYSPAEKVEAAAEIGYKVMGPLKPSERLFKPYEPVFAVVQVSCLLDKKTLPSFIFNTLADDVECFGSHSLSL